MFSSHETLFSSHETTENPSVELQCEETPQLHLDHMLHVNMHVAQDLSIRVESCQAKADMTSGPVRLSLTKQKDLLIEKRDIPEIHF